MTLAVSRPTCVSGYEVVTSTMSTAITTVNVLTAVALLYGSPLGPAIFERQSACTFGSVPVRCSRVVTSVAVVDTVTVVESVSMVAIPFAVTAITNPLSSGPRAVFLYVVLNSKVIKLC